MQEKQGRPLQLDSIFLTAANFSIHQSLFWQLGGFDSRLTDAEDFDLAVRAHEAGISLYYNHDAFAFHEDMLTGNSYIKRLRQYREAHERLWQLEPERYASIRLNRPHIPKGVKALYFRFFAQPFWVKWLDQERLKKIIPRVVRYKLYDFIITANGVYFPRVVSLS
jgi:GT2 family glycosyltransferase